AKGLYHASAIPVRPSQLPQQRTEPWTIARRIRGRHVRLVLGATDRTPPLMQHEVLYLQFDRGQLQHLVRIVRPERGEGRIATRTPLRPEIVHRCRWQQHLAMAWMAWFPTRFAGRGSGGTQARLLVRRVR